MPDPHQPSVASAPLSTGAPQEAGATTRDPLDLAGQLRQILEELKSLVRYEHATLALVKLRDRESLTGLEPLAVISIEELRTSPSRRSDARHFPTERLAELLENGQPLLLTAVGAGASAPLSTSPSAPLSTSLAGERREDTRKRGSGGGRIPGGSWLGLPLHSRGVLSGALAIERCNAAFDGTDLRVAGAFARQIISTIDNARLYEETRRRAEAFGLLYKIADAATRLDQDEVLDVIYREVTRALGADTFFIALLDRTGTALEFRVAYDSGRPLEPFIEPLAGSASLSAHVVRSGDSILVGDYERDGASLPAPGMVMGNQTRSMIKVPLKAIGRLVGVMSVQSTEADRFDPDALRLMETIASQAAVSIQNARFTTDIGRRLAEMTTLYEMAQKATSSLELSEVLDAIVTTLKELLKARAASIMLVDPETQMLSIRAASGIKEKWVTQAKLKVGEGTSGRVVATATPEYVLDTHADPEFIFFDPSVRSLLTVPLKVKDRVIGTLSVDSNKPNAFTQDDERLLIIAAAQAAVAIENAQLYADLKTRFHNLQAVDRLRDELVQNVSHELRTPLTFIKGYVDLLLEKDMGPLNERQRHSMEVVQAKTTQLSRLVEDIVSVQRIEHGTLDLRPLALDEVAALAVSAAELSAEAGGVKLRLEVPQSLPPVAGDHDRLLQVFDNLLGNALKFSLSGSETVVRLCIAPQGDRVLVSVSDQGVGIPAPELKRVFERFYQVDSSSRRRYGGVGLGLAIVQRIIHAHNGEIWVESEVGKGSTFFFTVPLATGR